MTSSEGQGPTLSGHGAHATIVGDVLRIDANNRAGKVALGAEEREVPLSDVSAIAFKEASMLVNGAITVQSSVGVSKIHFLKKSSDSARELFDALQAQSNRVQGAVPTGGYANEKNAARREAVERRRREIDQRWIDAKAQQAHDFEEWRANHAAGRARIAEQYAEATRALGDPHDSGQRALPVSALLDAAEREASTQWDVTGGDGPDATLEIGGGPDETNTVGLSDGDSPADLLRLAEEAAAAGDIVGEELSIAQALVLAKALGGRKGRKSTEGDIRQREADGALRVGSELLGEVVAESGLEQYSRKKALTKIVPGTRRITVRSDRVLAGGAVRLLDEYTSAQVYLDGQEQVLQRPTLTRMMLLSPLPGSALIPGFALQKKTTHDNREAAFQIGSVGWSFRVSLAPYAVGGAREVAEQVNRAASMIGKSGEAATHTPPSSSPDDVLTQLERLTYLVEKGAISAEEAERLRSHVLKSLGAK